MLTVYTLHYDESDEDVLQWINHCEKFADELVIVHTKTNKFYGKKGSKLREFYIQQNEMKYSNGWRQSYHRNEALRQSRGNHILQLDMDERINIGWLELAEKYIRLYPDLAAFGMKIINYWDNMDTVRVNKHWYPCWQYRLIKNDHRIQYKRGARHLRLLVTPDIRNLKQEVGNLPWCLEGGIESCIHHLKYTKPIPIINGFMRCNQTDSRPEDMNRNLLVKSFVERFGSETKIAFF